MKAVEPPSIKYPDEMHKMDKETFFFCKWIDKISTKRRKNRRFLIITDWEFFVLKKKTFSKKLILSYSFRWYDITSVDHDDERPEEFTIRFKNRKNKKKSETIQTIQNNYSKKRDYFTFKYPRTEKMLTKLYSYLNSFHMPQDLPKFNFPTDFPYPNAKGSITDHIRMKLRLRNHRISTSTLNALKKFISNEPSEFSFTEIRGIISFLPIFMECIYLAESIDTLIIPFDTNFNSLKILNDFLPENRNITSLVFKERLPGDFSDFKKTFLSTTATENITSLKFINSNFTDQNVIDISGIVSKRTIKTLHLKNSLGPLTLKPFLQKVYDNPGFQSITNFSLDHTQSIDIRTLMPYLKNVTTLTLIHCEFEIADLFDVLTEDYSMISLNISQNNNDKQIFNIISFPKYLSTIVLRDIKWELLSLSNFIESVMNHRPISSKDEIANNEIKLDLSQIKMSDEDWSSFFIQLDEKQRGSVVSLGWDNNPIDRHFIDFINSFLNLSYLSLNGIIIPKSEDFDSLLRFIANSTTLTALSIHGTELQNLGKNIMAVIDTLYVNRSIRRIDINNHKCGNNMMLKLADVMIQNRVVDEISFCSRNDINDISLFELFFIVVGQYRGKPLFTEFPSSFVKSALQFGSISDKRCEKLKYDYDFMVRGNPSITIPETSIKRNLLKKFSVKNYINDPTLIDYDDNAKIRRNQIEKKYKFEAKKVQRQDDDVDNDENDENYMVDDDFMLEENEENNEKLNSMKNGKRKRRKSIKRPKNKKTNEKNELQIDKEDENLNSDELEKKEEEEINELPFALSEDEQAIISPQTKSKNKKKKKNKNEEEEANEQLEEEKVETSLAVSINDINAELGNLLLANEEEEEAKESKTKNKKSKKASKSTKTHKKEESDELSVPADEESPQNETEDAD